MYYVDLIFLAITKPKNCDDPSSCPVNLPEINASDGTAEKIFGIVFGTIAAIAVLIIVLSAMNWAIRGGDPEVITRSRKAIVYAAIGLAIALLSELLVLTLLDRL